MWVCGVEGVVWMGVVPYVEGVVWVCGVEDVVWMGVVDGTVGHGC